MAFENYNKAVLIENGYLVHRIQKNDKTKDFWALQEKGQPVTISDFKQKCDFVNDNRFRKNIIWRA